MYIQLGAHCSAMIEVAKALPLIFRPLPTDTPCSAVSLRQVSYLFSRDMSLLITRPVITDATVTEIISMCVCTRQPQPITVPVGVALCMMMSDVRAC